MGGCSDIDIQRSVEHAGFQGFITDGSMVSFKDHY